MFTLLASDSFVSTKSVFSYPICDSPLWRLARRSFTLLQKLHRNHRKLECRVYEHLKFSGKTNDRRKCSRSTLAEAYVDKRVAGKKGSTNKYRCRPTSAGDKSTSTPKSETQSTSQPQTRLYSAIYHNDNPFVLRILPKEAKICKGCNNHFCHR